MGGEPGRMSRQRNTARVPRGSISRTDASGATVSKGDPSRRISTGSARALCTHTTPDPITPVRPRYHTAQTPSAAATAPSSHQPTRLRAGRSSPERRTWRSTLTAPTSCDGPERSEEHTSELQSRLHLVCRLLLEKKKKQLQ